MSLILDALRKSEAERRRGQSPDLFAGAPVAGAPRPSPWPRALPALLLVALALIATLVLWPRRPDAVTALAENGSGSERSAEVGADVRSAGGGLAPAAGDTASASANAPDLTRHAPETSRLGPPGATLDQAVTPGLRAQAPASAPTQASAPTSTQAPASTTTRTPTSSSTPATIATPSAPSAPTPAASAQSTTLSTSATPAADTDDNPGEALPPIAVLAASERAALPPLKLSMHVWNSEPRKRFAIIDGQRVTEGATAGAGVIEEIRRDGVVLNLNGRRVLLPRP